MAGTIQKGYPGLELNDSSGIAYKNIRFYGQLSGAGQIRNGKGPKIDLQYQKRTWQIYDPTRN